MHTSILMSASPLVGSQYFLVFSYNQKFIGPTVYVDNELPFIIVVGNSSHLSVHNMTANQPICRKDYDEL